MHQNAIACALSNCYLAHPGAARVTSTSVKSTTPEIFTPEKSKLPMGDNIVKKINIRTISMDIHSLKTDIAKKNLKAQNPPKKI